MKSRYRVGETIKLVELYNIDRNNGRHLGQKWVVYSLGEHTLRARRGENIATFTYEQIDKIPINTTSNPFENQMKVIHKIHFSNDEMDYIEITNKQARDLHNVLSGMFHA